MKRMSSIAYVIGLIKPNVLTDSGSTSACRFEKQTPQLQLLFSSRSLSMDLVKRSATMCSLMQRLVLLLQHRRLQLQVGPRLVPHEPKPQAQQRTRRRQRRSLRVLMCPLQQTKPPVIPSPVPTLIGLPPGLHHLHPQLNRPPQCMPMSAAVAGRCSGFVGRSLQFCGTKLMSCGPSCVLAGR